MCQGAAETRAAIRQPARRCGILMFTAKTSTTLLTGRTDRCPDRPHSGGRFLNRNSSPCYSRLPSTRPSSVLSTAGRRNLEIVSRSTSPGAISFSQRARPHHDLSPAPSGRPENDLRTPVSGHRSLRVDRPAGRPFGLPIFVQQSLVKFCDYPEVDSCFLPVLFHVTGLGLSGPNA